MADENSGDRVMGWHEKWCRGLIPDHMVEQVYLEGPYGEITTYDGDQEIKTWPTGNPTVRSKQWYRENYYGRINNGKGT